MFIAKKRTTATLAAVVLLGLTLSACGDSGKTPGATASSSEATPSATAAPDVTETPTEADEPAEEAPSPEVNLLNYEVNDQMGIVANGPVLSDQYGSYTQVTLAETSPLNSASFDAITPEASAAYTEEQLNTAQAFVSNFLITQSLDSPLVWDDREESVSAFVEQTVPLINDSYEGDFRDLFGYDDGKGYIITDSNDTSWRETLGYTPTAYVPNQARYAIKDISVSNIDLTEDGGLRFDYGLEYNRTAQKTETGEVLIENVAGTRSYGVTLNEDNQWEIAGWAQQVEFNFDAPE